MIISHKTKIVNIFAEFFYAVCMSKSRNFKKLALAHEFTDPHAKAKG